jgi:prepilin-type N-terminal cleavage/methylation domain-containing protein
VSRHRSERSTSVRFPAGAPSLRVAAGRGGSGGSAGGFTLVEVLVATLVFSLNAVALFATLMLALTLLRAAALALEGLDALDLAQACGAAASLVGRLGRPTMAPVRSRAPRAPRRGLTLVEVLVALAIGGVILLALGSFAAATSSGRRALEARSDRLLIDHGMRLLFEGDVTRAGAGLAADECGLAIGAAGSRLDVWWRGSDGELHQIGYAAGVDGAGRPALYRRHHPHARQPWLEDVVALRVHVAERVDGGGLARAAALDVALDHATSDPSRWRVPLHHHPCEAPAP